jgi:hypothetical protein
MCTCRCFFFIHSEDAQNCDQRKMQILDKKQRQNLEFNWQRISEQIENVDEFIKELNTRTCITMRQFQTIKKQPPSLQAKKLFEILTRKSVGVFDVFVGCLPDSARHYLENLLKNISGNLNYQQYYSLCVVLFILIRVR